MANPEKMRVLVGNILSQRVLSAPTRSLLQSLDEICQFVYQSAIQLGVPSEPYLKGSFGMVLQTTKDLVQKIIDPNKKDLGGNVSLDVYYTAFKQSISAYLESMRLYNIAAKNQNVLSEVLNSRLQQFDKNYKKYQQPKSRLYSLFVFISDKWSKSRLQSFWHSVTNTFKKKQSVKDGFAIKSSLTQVNNKLRVRKPRAQLMRLSDDRLIINLINDAVDDDREWRHQRILQGDRTKSLAPLLKDVKNILKEIDVSIQTKIVAPENLTTHKWYSLIKIGHSDLNNFLVEQLWFRTYLLTFSTKYLMALVLEKQHGVADSRNINSPMLSGFVLSILKDRAQDVQTLLQDKMFNYRSVRTFFDNNMLPNRNIQADAGISDYASVSSSTSGSPPDSPSKRNRQPAAELLQSPERSVMIAVVA